MMKLYPYQIDAIRRMHNGSILNGGVGSGKSLTALGYYYLFCGGAESFLRGGKHKRMLRSVDLYIITTAMKRDTKEWEKELSYYLLSTNKELNSYSNSIIVDSWNNIKKYSDVKEAFFIFDEDRVTGNGAWVKAFLKIARGNNWIILSATPGDTWSDYIPIFIANGFYRNRTEFIREHVVYSRFTKYPKIQKYLNVGRLIRLRNKILVDMDFSRKTISHHEDIFCDYNRELYNQALKQRWDIFKDEPIKQASDLCYILRKVVNVDESRQLALLELLEDHPKTIIFYNFDYELDILKYILEQYEAEKEFEVAEWNGHKHQPIPNSKAWTYLVQYNAGCEGWNSISTDTIIFYSQNYSYRTMTQAAGRIDRLNTPFKNLYYYHLKSKSSIDLAISKALHQKKNFNEGKFIKW